MRSAFLRVRPRAEPLLAPGELARVERVVRAAFSQRRKTLTNALQGGLDPAPDPARLAQVLAALEIDPRARAERLPPERFLALARRLAGEGA